ncbi:uncharacterized protein zgc:162331 isoform X1 [Entelurus aequoreus]|uniref:uncharacterized protein zgc:162331 isoform X1 n=1 Tax=Entelurus aequoreus TaxID=161455 RepID=UPI002B1DBCD5|nr:uncharacterized protein zgc:162331 isoform X1 [Entelurus aequoreus]
MECCPGMRSEHVTRTSFTMFPKVRVPSQSVHLWVMLLCTPVLTRTSEPVSEDLQNFTAATAPGNWTGATMQLQPEGLTTAKVQTETPTSNYTGVSCVALLPPRGGSFYVESGTGMSVGSSLVFWCREGFQLLGSHKIHCLVRNGNARWSDYLPECQGELRVAPPPWLPHHFFSHPSHPQAGGPWIESRSVGVGGERHRHPGHVALLPGVLPAGTLQQHQRCRQQAQRKVFSPSQAAIINQSIMAGKRRRRVGELPPSQHLPSVSEDGSRQRPLPAWRPRGIGQQRISQEPRESSKGAPTGGLPLRVTALPARGPAAGPASDSTLCPALPAPSHASTPSASQHGGVPRAHVPPLPQHLCARLPPPPAAARPGAHLPRHRTHTPAALALSWTQTAGKMDACCRG